VVTVRIARRMSRGLVTKHQRKRRCRRVKWQWNWLVAAGEAGVMAAQGYWALKEMFIPCLYEERCWREIPLLAYILQEHVISEREELIILVILVQNRRPLYRLVGPRRKTR
jgi:hypothetical protein